MPRKKPPEPEVSNSTDVNSQQAQFDRPQICAFDLRPEDREHVLKSGFKVEEASFGRAIKVPNVRRDDEHYCLANYSIPDNLHEFEIFLFDFQPDQMVDYDEKLNIRGESRDTEQSYLVSSFPQRVLDPRPLAAALVADRINKSIEAGSIIIVFACSPYTQEYLSAKITREGSRSLQPFTSSIYSFCKGLMSAQEKTGTTLKPVFRNKELQRIIAPFLDSATYHATFIHPQILDRETNDYVNDPSFHPFLQDVNGEIVSFGRAYEKSLLLVFPQIAQKGKLLTKLLSEFLPNVAPAFFPYATSFGWRNSQLYYPPNHEDLLAEKKRIEEEFSTKLSAIEHSIAANSTQFKFLHDLLCETGDTLVLSVKIFLEWLGFSNVALMDEEGRIKEDDLQIETDRGLLVIEVKGIGGTSTDKDCSQIQKIVTRQQRRRKKFDVHGIYIVNHQRYLPPLQRQNPPFSSDQIDDALEDQRGLLTTWQLFTLYRHISDGHIRKADARESLWSSGLVEFQPPNYIGNVSEVFQKGSVFIMKLQNTKIRVGDDLVFQSGGNFSADKILELRIHDKSVQSASNVEVGISVSGKVRLNASVFLKSDQSK